ILRELEREMNEAALAMRYERAAKLRDEIKALQSLGKRAGKGDEKFWQPEAFIQNPREGVTALQEALGIAEPPRILEGIDIGHLHAALEVFKTMDVKPPMVISLAKKEELVYVQARSEPIRLTRNNIGLKLLQYIRDEAHRFAQHYHHILRRKSQLEEDVKKGRRPPKAGVPRRKRAAKASGDAADPEKGPDKAPGEMPHTTHVGLPVLGSGSVPQTPDPLAV